MSRDNAEKAFLVPLLGAMCFFFSTIEYMLPKPAPFIRLGIANIPIMAAIDLLPFPSVLSVVFLKIFGQAVFSGSLFSYAFVFSCAGSLASALLMFFMRKVFPSSFMSWIGVSAAGAMVSNAAQLTASYFFVFGKATLYSAPALLTAGLITGTCSGAFFSLFSEKSKWFAQRLAARSASGGDGDLIRVEPAYFDDKSQNASSAENLKPAAAFFRAAEFLFFLLLFILVPRLSAKCLLCAFFFVLSHRAGKKNGVPAFFLTTASIIFCNILLPFGEEIFTIGSLPITDGALRLGIEKAVLFEGLIFLSRWFTAVPIQIPGAAGRTFYRSCRYFERLTAARGKIKAKRFISDVDNLLIEITEADTIARRERREL